MLGAENRGNVTCYLDSLLFAMFAHLTAFESMLKNDLENEPQRKLAALIRLWVNMLRSGKLIHTDMVWHTLPLFCSSKLTVTFADGAHTAGLGRLRLERSRPS
jgi:uncharacterized protein YfdQ (DUF2303 family)